MRYAAFAAILAWLALAAATPAAADGSTQAPEHKITQSESYEMLEPMYATVLDDDKPCGMLMVAIGLDIPDAKLRAEADHDLPVLRDAYVRSLMNYAWTHVRPWEQPDVVDIANHLQRITDRALNRPGARVLLAQVSLRVTR